MIRRDYILRMIEDFVRALARIRSLKNASRWEEAEQGIDEEFQRLVGDECRKARDLSETELLGLLMTGQPTQAVREKIWLATTLLKDAGDVARARGQVQDARETYLKALHLLLEAVARSDVLEMPEFVPKIDVLLAALEPPLPARTQAGLMQFYERTEQFAKAEDALFAMLEVDPHNRVLLEFGLAFYRRLIGRDDASLQAGNLPRVEVEQGLKEVSLRLLQTDQAG